MIPAVLAAVLATASAFECAATPGAQAVPASRDLASTAAIVDHGLVHLEVPDGYGTGFLFRDSRTIVTAAHVVSEVPLGGEVVIRTIAEDAEGAAVLAPAAPAVLRLVHPEIDLAILDWTEPSPGAAALEARPSPKLLPRGTEVLVHGFPGEMAPTLARGIVSAHQYDFTDGHVYYFLDAAMGSGGSGGPVTDLAGRLVGVVNAVYDDGEASNFNWAYAIPLRHVEALVPAGGVSALPKPRTLEARIRAIESAEGFEAQVAARQREVVELAGEAPTIDRLHESVTALLAAIGPMPQPSTAAEFGRAEEATVLVARALSERAVVLAWRQDPADELEAYQMWRDGRGHDPAWACEAAFDFGPAPEGNDPQDSARMLSVMANRLRMLMEETRRGCDRVCEYASCPPFEERSVDRAAVIAGYAAIDLLSCRLDEAEILLGLLSDEGLPEDLAVARALDRLARAAEAAHAEWFSLPSACRDARFELDGLDSAALRGLLELAGYRRIESTSIEVAPFSIAEASPTIAFTLERSGSPVAVYAIATPSDDTSDIDLRLSDRSGRPIDADERGEAFAVVSASSDEPGPWFLEVLNPGDDPQSVRIEFWGKPGAVRIRRQAEE